MRARMIGIQNHHDRTRMPDEFTYLRDSGRSGGIGLDHRNAMREPVCLHARANGFRDLYIDADYSPLAHGLAQSRVEEQRYAAANAGFNNDFGLQIEDDFLKPHHVLG